MDEQALIAGLNRILDDAGSVLTGAAAKEQSGSDWSRMGTPVAFVRPRTTDQVSAILKYCNDLGVPISPWGGKTGLVHGGFADGHVALSLERLAAVEEIDRLGSTITVQAGCILQVAAEGAAGEGLLLPIDLGARGSAMIGGILSTNAGGNSVIRYGMARDNVLGLEAVLADGTILSSMNHLIKNNAGYDLKQLFIGSEGTLGVITRAVLRLRPMPTSQNTAFVGVDAFDHLPELLRHMERGLAGTLCAYEVMWSDFYELVTNPPALGKAPLEGHHPFYVLVEAQGQDDEKDKERFETLLGEAMERRIVADAVLAKSQSERNAMWELRDDIGQTARNWPIFTYDVSLRVHDMQAYVEEVRAALKAGWADKATLTIFGHMGDGNLHLIAGVGSRDKETKRAVDEIVYGGVRSRHGSVSAEHGIGVEKRDYLGWSRSADEVATMRLLKRALDPKGILNPDKIFTLEPG